MQFGGIMAIQWQFGNTALRHYGGVFRYGNTAIRHYGGVFHYGNTAASTGWCNTLRRRNAVMP